MIQVLDDREESFGTKIGRGFGQGMQKGLESKRMAEQLRQEKQDMVSFGDKIMEQYPDDPMYQTIGNIYKHLPPKAASDAVKAITGIDPFKAEQQKRLMLDSVYRRYNHRIKELDDEIKTARYSERSALIEQRDKIKAERDKLQGFDYFGDQGQQEEDFEEDEELSPDQKVTFDANNSKHRHVAEKLFEQHKDKEKVREILSRRFKI